ncbi:MAG: extracellular solute-binding protein [Chloroflexota bacterium]|nr:extracellular solute-binding protein [Chloroflexota bacterium]MDE2909207.1 extracellular solute-binding protein [Chloroflexota bacterium]
MLRRICLIVLALTVISVFAVGAQDEAQYAGLDMDLSGITIRMANIGGGQYEAMYESISVFEEATGATVEIVALLDGFAIDQKLKVDFATGAADYDVAWDHTSFVAQYTNFLLPLQDFFSEEELAAFSPAILEAATIDGNLYLIPRHADISPIHYRADLYTDDAIAAAYMDATGEELSVPSTLEQIDRQARFFVDNGHATFGYVLAGKEEALTGRFYEMLFASGGALFNDAYEPTFNDEIGVAVAELLASWYADGVIPSDTTSLLWDGVAQYFCNNDVAIKLEWYGWYAYFQGADSCAVAGNFGLARGFTGLSVGGDAVRPSGWAGAHAFSIPATAPNPQAGAQLIKFLASERVAYEEALLGFLPTRNDVWDRIIADAADAENPLDRERLELARIQVGEDFKTPPLIAEWIPFSNLFYPQLQAIILGDIGAQAGLDAAAEATRELMADAGYF